MNYRRLAPVALLAVLAFGAYPIFTYGELLLADNPSHLVDAFYMGKFLSEGHWYTGWAGYEYAGMPLFLYYPYFLGFFAVAALGMLPLVSLALAYKIMVYFATLLPALALYYVLRRDVKEKYALASAVVWLLNPFMLANTIRGIWNISLGIPLFLLVFSLLRKPGQQDRRWMAKLSLALALALLVHYYCFIACGVVALAFMLSSVCSKKCRLILPTVGALLLSLLVAGFYAYPLLSSLGWGVEVASSFEGGVIAVVKMLTSSGVYLSEPVAMLKSGQVIPALSGFLYRNIVLNSYAILLLAGAALALKQKAFLLRERVSILSILLFFALVAFSSLFTGMPLLKFVQGTRFMIFFQLLLVFYMAFGMQKFLEGRKLTPKISALLLIFCLMFAVEMYGDWADRNSDVLTSDNFAYYSDAPSVFNWVEQNADASARTYYQSLAARGIAFSHAMALARLETTKPMLGAWSGGGIPYPQQDEIRSDLDRLFGVDAAEATDAYVAGMMEKYNCKHIAVHTSAAKAVLSGSELFVKEAEYGQFQIYTLDAYQPSVVEGAELLSYKEGEIRIRMGPGTATIKEAYHPFWTGARAPSHPVKVSGDSFLISVLASPGDTVTLTYSPPKSGLWLTLAGLAITIYLFTSSETQKSS